MISIGILVISLIVGVFMFLNNAKNEVDMPFLKPVLVVVMGLLIGFIQPYSLERIDAGNKGIVVNLSGSERGVAKYQYKTGWVVYNSWTTQVLEFPIFQQHIEYDDQSVILKGGFSATIKPTFNYSLREDAIGDMFVNLRRPIVDVEQGWLKNAIIGAVNDVANTWEVDSIFNHRQAFEYAIVVECNVRLAKWFNVSQLRTNITPPETLQEAIIAKTKAIQQAEASEPYPTLFMAGGEKRFEHMFQHFWRHTAAIVPDDQLHRFCSGPVLGGYANSCYGGDGNHNVST